MAEHPRDCCQVCGIKMMGGDDAVSYLHTPFDSFHYHQHLKCYLKNERDLCAALVEGREDLGEGRLSLAQAIRSLSSSQ